MLARPAFRARKTSHAAWRPVWRRSLPANRRTPRRQTPCLWLRPRSLRSRQQQTLRLILRPKEWHWSGAFPRVRGDETSGEVFQRPGSHCPTGWRQIDLRKMCPYRRSRSRVPRSRCPRQRRCRRGSVGGCRPRYTPRRSLECWTVRHPQRRHPPAKPHRSLPPISIGSRGRSIARSSAVSGPRLVARTCCDVETLTCQEPR